MKLFKICLWLLPVCSFAQTNEDEWETISQPDFSIQYPSEWTLDQSGQMGTKYLFFSPLESPDDKFRENVNVMVQDITGYNLNLSGYAKLSEEQIRTMFVNAKIIESKQFSLESTAYHRIVYTGDVQTYHLKFEQYYFIKGNVA